MAKRALLVGCPYGDLAGPLQDVGRIAALLESKGFTIHRCVGPDATRDGILKAYRSLIDGSGSRDAAAIYYSGHGARSLDEAYVQPDANAPPKRFHHFIVPMDIDESCEGDFRGILSLELSSLLAQLTAKTINVTLIFDCCHSGGMTRDLRLRPRGLSRDWFAGAHGHVERFTHGAIPGFPRDLIAVEGNPYAVRVMAALPSQQAWEFEGTHGTYGLMTDALVSAFEEAEDRPVTWDAITRRVRELVRQKEPGQYPDVEGPGSRFVFELEEADLTGVVPIELSEDGPILLGGLLLGVGKGDEYTIMPPGFQSVDRERALARATVTFVTGAWSAVILDPDTAAVQLPAGAQAFPLRRAHRRKSVVVRAGTKVRPALERTIEESQFLRVPAEGGPLAPSDVLATVEERGDGLAICEQDERELVSPLTVTRDVDDVAKAVADNLDRLARARELETLASGVGPSRLTAEYELEWGRVVAGVPTVLRASGALLSVGDRIFVRVRNKSRSTLYVSVFDIGLAGKITLLTRNWASSGVELQPGGAPFTLGYREGLGWKGLGPVTWPMDVPKDGRPRPESLAVVVCDRAQDLRALESPGMAVPKSAEATRSELERIVDQVATGRTRDTAAEDPPPDVHYSVNHISMLVDPTESAVRVPVVSAPESCAARGGGAAAGAPASIVPAIAVPDVAPFLIDERPEPSAAYRHARGVQMIPAALAVQLGEVIVHNNRALFSADVRVDALVITGSQSSEGLYRAATARFEHIKDGDRLPLENLLAFHGPVRGFVDLAVWVSRDDTHGLALAELLKKQLGSTEFKDAALILAGLVVAAPTAGAVIAGIGAATTVANITYKVLSAAAGSSIGLYRTSLLANERFGVGRHPATGNMRAQDFSFWYQVIDVT